MSGAPYFFFELILSRSIFSSVSWYLLDFLLCIIFQGKTATTWPFSSGTANWFFYSEGNTNREKKTSSGRQNGDGNCHRYQSFSSKIFVPVRKYVFFWNFHARKGAIHKVRTQHGGGGCLQNACKCVQGEGGSLTL